MKKFDTHVCMVSGQAAPNILPLLDEALKPKKVLLLVTPAMSKKAEYLKAVITPLGVKVEIQSLDTADNFQSIQETLLNLICEQGDSSIALNVTGGTKWMAIAAQEVFRVNELPVFYVNISDDSVQFLGEKQLPHQLAQRIKLTQFLTANGYTSKDNSPQGMEKSLLELCQVLVSKVGNWEKALAQLNNLASFANAKNTLRVSFVECKIVGPDPHLGALLNELHEAGIVATTNTSLVEFSDDNARTFANGGWLEAYVNHLLLGLKGEGVIQDSPRLNLRICSPQNSENEIDVAFMAKNHLHLIECKTKRFTGESTGQAGTEALYKLDSISDLGGLGTKSMLVSYRKLRDADRQRAKDLRIKVVEGEAIAQLKTQLRNWITNVRS